MAFSMIPRFIWLFYDWPPETPYIPTALLDGGSLENSRESRKSGGVGSVQAGGEFNRLGSLPLKDSTSCTVGPEGMGGTGSLNVVGGEGIGDRAGVDPDAPGGDLY